MNICSSVSEHMFKCQRTYVRGHLNICSYFYLISTTLQKSQNQELKREIKPIILFGIFYSETKVRIPIFNLEKFLCFE